MLDGDYTKEEERRVGVDKRGEGGLYLRRAFGGRWGLGSQEREGGAVHEDGLAQEGELFKKRAVQEDGFAQEDGLAQEASFAA